MSEVEQLKIMNEIEQLKKRLAELEQQKEGIVKIKNENEEL